METHDDYPIMPDKCLYNRRPVVGDPLWTIPLIDPRQIEEDERDYREVHRLLREIDFDQWMLGGTSSDNS